MVSLRVIVRDQFRDGAPKWRSPSRSIRPGRSSLIDGTKRSALYLGARRNADNPDAVAFEEDRDRTTPLGVPIADKHLAGSRMSSTPSVRATTLACLAILRKSVSTGNRRLCPPRKSLSCRSLCAQRRIQDYKSFAHGHFLSFTSISRQSFQTADEEHMTPRKAYEVFR